MKTLKEKLSAKLSKNSGFTLVEMLLVVAIIAVLIAVSIPVVTGQLEKAREATDAANLRVAYATASIKVLESEGSVSAGPVAMTQATAGFETDVKNSTIGGTALSSLTDAKSGVSYYVTIGADGSVEFEKGTATGSVTIDPVTGATTP